MSPAIANELGNGHAFRDSVVGMLLLDPQGRCVRVNEAALRLLGQSREALLSVELAAFVHPDDVPALFAHRQELHAGGREAFELDLRWRISDSRAIQARLHGSPVRDADGAVVLLLVQVQAPGHQAEEARDAFFALSPDLLAVATPDGWLREVNPAWTAVLGWSAQELTSRPFIEFVHPDDRTRTASESDLTFGGDGTPRFRNRYRTRSGDYRWLEWNTRAARDGRIYCAARDVTAEHEARLALEHEAGRRGHALATTQRMLDLHIGHTPLASIEWDADFRVRRWSARAQALFGWREDEVLGRRMDEWRFVHEDDAAGCATLTRTLRDGATPQVMHANRNYTRDGTVLRCEWFNSAVFDAEGRLVSVLSLAQDVTQRECALEAMRENERLFRMTFEQAAVGMAHVGLDGRWLRVNATLCALLGYTQDELLSRTCQDITHADHLEALLALARRMLDGEIDHGTLEKRHLHRDGHAVWTLLTVSLRRDDASRPLHFIAVIEDIGARKSAEAALHAAHAQLEARVAERTRALAAEVQQRRDIETALRASEDRVRGILENCHDAFIAIEEDGRVAEWNRSAEAIFGWRRSEMLGRVLYEAIVPRRLRLKFASGLAAHRTGNGRNLIGQRLQLSALHRNGREFPVEFTLSETHTGERRLFTGFLHDISERIAAEQQLREKKALLRTITDNVPALIAHVDRDVRYRFANATYREWFDQDPDRLVGRSIDEVIGPVAFAQVQPFIRRVLDGERVDFDIQFPTRDGGVRHAHASYVPDCDEHGHVRGFFVLASDITVHKQLAQMLEKRALHDELTGLPNRAGWADHVERGLARAQRNGTPAVVMFLDVDGLKPVNDAHGHEAGDALLREFAARLTASVRRSDVVARLAGDEFVVLLENIHDPERDPAAIARKVLAAMAPAFEFRGRPLALSTSIGVAVQRAGGFDADELLRRADEAMYRAKRDGAGRFEVVEL